MHQTRVEFEKVAAWLLGRPLTTADGVPVAKCEAVQQRLGRALPPPLQAFHCAVGAVPQFTSAFQRFASPDECMLRDGKIVFLEENQGVCWWAADVQGRVYQAMDLDAGPWEEESVDLAEFLRVLLYYQMAQGGYAQCGMRADAAVSTAADADALIAQMNAQRGARPVVDMSGLRIFAVAEQVLVWYLHDAHDRLDPGLFLSALDPKKFEHWSAQWAFDALD